MRNYFVEKLLVYFIAEEICTGCGRCVQVCPNHAILWAGEKVQIQPALCHQCGRCLEACPNHAIIVRAEALQKARPAVPEAATAAACEVETLRASRKQLLLTRMLDGLIGVADLLAEHFSKPEQKQRRVNAGPLQGRSMQGGNGRRRRRGGARRGRAGEHTGGLQR